MSDESEGSDLLKIPFRQKDAWEWAFRAALLAGYFYLISHFVTQEKYERDLDKQEAQRSIIITSLSELNTKLGIVDEHIKNYDKLESRVQNLENRSYATHP